MSKSAVLVGLLAVILLISSNAFDFHFGGGKVNIGRGVLSPAGMAKRDSGSGGAVPTPQPDNIQSWGKSLCFCAVSWSHWLLSI